MSKRDQLAQRILVGVAIVASASFAFWMISREARSDGVYISGNQIVFDTPFVRRSFQVSTDMAERAHVIDLVPGSPYWPIERIVGNSVTRQGKFKLANGTTGFVRTRQDAPVFVVPVSDATALVVSPNDPTDFRNRLIQAASK